MTFIATRTVRSIYFNNNKICDMKWDCEDGGWKEDFFVDISTRSKTKESTFFPIISEENIRLDDPSSLGSLQASCEDSMAKELYDAVSFSISDTSTSSSGSFLRRFSSVKVRLGKRNETSLFREFRLSGIKTNFLTKSKKCDTFPAFVLQNSNMEYS